MGIVRSRAGVRARPRRPGQPAAVSVSPVAVEREPAAGVALPGQPAAVSVSPVASRMARRAVRVTRVATAIVAARPAATRA